MSLAGIVVVLVVAGLGLAVAPIFRHMGFPPAVSTVLVGIAVGGMLPQHLDVALTPGILGVFLPALIFESAWDIDVSVIRRVALTVFVLAVVGTLLTAAIIGAAAYVAGIGLAAAFVLGAILSATDPVAVLALFRNLHLPDELLAIVEGESIANDGVAVLLVQTVMPFAVLGVLPSLAPATLQAVGNSLGALAIGLAFALVISMPLRAKLPVAVHAALTVVAAYGSYALAVQLGCSGIFASAAAGVALPAFALRRNDAEQIERFWDGVALVANVLVFALVGLSLQFEGVLHEPRLIVATCAGVVVSRALLAYVVAPLRGVTSESTWRNTIALAGLRGGLPIALVLGLPRAFPHRPELIGAVFAVVFLTLVVQGWLIGPLARRLDFGTARPSGA